MIDTINMIANNFKSNLDRALSKNESDISFNLNNKIIRLFKNKENKNMYHLTDDETFFETGSLKELAEIFCKMRG